MRPMTRRALTCLAMASCALPMAAPHSAQANTGEPARTQEVRFATFNASLNRGERRRSFRSADAASA